MSFDKSQFTEKLQVLALRIPKPKCHEFMRKFRGFTLEKPKVKCLVDEADRTDTKLLLLDEKVTDVGALSDELRGIVDSHALEQLQHTVTLDYSCLSATQVLRKLLPPEVDVPTSFECVGHLAHLNLREDQLPHKAVIGAVMLDKNPSLKTIVNKVGNIETEFRVFPMEVIAGVDSTETQVMQHGARFRLDFAKVYWNSRLEQEHRRLVSQFQTGDVIVDLMAGIGPFAVPAAKHGCTVYANDLNPDSVTYLATNVRLNKVAANVHVFNMCGRQFARLLLATPGGPADALPPADEESPQIISGDERGGATPAGTTTSAASTAAAPQPSGTGSAAAPPPPHPPGFRPPRGGLVFQHAVMNLPASAVEFLDAFNGAFDPGTWRDQQLPMVHVYTFKRGTESEADIIAKVEHHLGGKLDAPPAVHMVRDVAPNKLMLCISFRVPAAVAFHKGDVQCNEPSEKRQKVE